MAPAMVPAAPPWFSTTTGTPSRALSPSARTRATPSLAPPGGNDTTRRIGRSGKAANAGLEHATITLARARRRVLSGGQVLMTASPAVTDLRDGCFLVQRLLLCHGARARAVRERRSSRGGNGSFRVCPRSRAQLSGRVRRTGTRMARSARSHRGALCGRRYDRGDRAARRREARAAARPAGAGRERGRGRGKYRSRAGREKPTRRQRDPDGHARAHADEPVHVCAYALRYRDGLRADRTGGVDRQRAADLAEARSSVADRIHRADAQARGRRELRQRGSGVGGPTGRRPVPLEG